MEIPALFENLDRFGANPALIQGEEKIDYQSLQVEVNGLKKLYSERRLAFLVCTNTIASVEAYLSCLQAKIPVVLINQHMDSAQLRVLVELYRPYYFWMPDDYLELVPSEHHRDYTFALLEKNKGENASMHEELSVMLTTSGSTGSPKLVRQSMKNVCANTISIIEYLEITEKDRAITTLPMHYTYGLSVLQTHIAAGASVILTDVAVINPQFWKLVEEKGATTFAGVPYTYEMLKKIRFWKRNLSSLRYLTQAGGRLGKDLHFEMADRCDEKGIQFIVMYGQTEATARMSYVPAERAKDKAGTIGLAIPGGKFWLEDANGGKIDTAYTTGELIYQGENVTMGYAEKPEDLELGYMQGNILHTGDMAQIDEDGFYFVVGRKKRFLKLFGNRVNMDETESILRREGIECAVGGKDDAMKVFVLSEDDAVKASEYLKTHTAIPPFGFSTAVIEEIPRNDAGKILYSKLED